MRISEHIAEQVADQIHSARRIGLIMHRNPDGDTAGAALAMYEMLSTMGKIPEVFCADPVPESFYFLPNNETLIHHFEPDRYDLVMIFDCGAPHMSHLHETYPEIFNGQYPLVNVDHHPSNDGFGKWNLVDIHSASTTQILTHLFNYLNWKITPRIATCLMTGLYTDTGSLKHSNADAEVHRVAAYLLKKGARLRDIVRYIFQNKSIGTLKLWGRVLGRISQTPDQITISTVSEKDFAETGTERSDLEGVVDYLNAVPNAKFSLLLTELKDKVKGSLRTLRDDIDLTAVAGQLGGGGHKKASGFTVAGKLQLQTRFQIITEDQSYEDSALCLAGQV